MAHEGTAATAGRGGAWGRSLGMGRAFGRSGRAGPPPLLLLYSYSKQLLLVWSLVWYEFEHL